MQVKSARPNRLWIILLAGLLLASTVVVVYPRGAKIPQQALELLRQAGNTVTIVEVEPAEISKAEPAPPPGKGQKPCITQTARYGTHQLLAAEKAGTKLFSITTKWTEILVKFTDTTVQIGYHVIDHETWKFSAIPREVFISRFYNAKGGPGAATRLRSLMDGWYKTEPLPYEEVTREEVHNRMGWDGTCK